MTRPDCIFLDASELPAPEPLQKALEALAELPRGKYLHFHHRQYPALLYERLESRGFAAVTRHGSDETVDVYIWHQDDRVAANRAREVAENHEPPEG